MSCEEELFIDRFALPSPLDNGDVLFNTFDYTVDEMAQKQDNHEWSRLRFLLALGFLDIQYRK